MMSRPPAFEMPVRTVRAQTPVLFVGTTDVTLLWPAQGPMPTAGYSASVNVEDGFVPLLGALSAVVKPGTKTVNGLTVTVTNSGLVPLTLGAGWIHVSAWY